MKTRGGTHVKLDMTDEDEDEGRDTLIEAARALLNSSAD